MRKIVSLVVCLCLMSVFSVATVFAEDGRITGNVTKIEMAADQKSALVTLKDTKSGESVVITVVDDETLGKLKDKKIVSGDEVRSRYEKKDGKNTSKLFRKTGGC